LERAAGIVTIRSLEGRDVDSILGIQAACPEIAQWTTRDYERVARGEMAGWVAEENSRVAGFLIARRVVNDLEVLNFAVEPEARRRGIGAALFTEATEWGKTIRAERIFLEVRISNLAALQFYERYDFRVMGRRPRYYTAPIEDALLLTAPLW
jgi:ribosomal-protein-alanine N-acetyltransferase